MNRSYKAGDAVIVDTTSGINTTYRYCFGFVDDVVASTYGVRFWNPKDRCWHWNVLSGAHLSLICSEKTWTDFWRKFI